MLSFVGRRSLPIRGEAPAAYRKKPKPRRPEISPVLAYASLLSSRAYSILADRTKFRDRNSQLLIYHGQLLPCVPHAELRGWYKYLQFLKIFIHHNW